MKKVLLLILLLVSISYSVPHVYFCVKIGDQLVDTHKGFKHLMPVTYVDPNDPNIQDDWVPNDSMRIPFLWFMDDSSNIDMIKNICQLYDSTVYNHPVFGASINLKRKYVLDKNTFSPQLRDEFSQKGYSKPIIDIRENINGVVYSDSNVSLIYNDTVIQYNQKRDKLLNKLKLAKLFLNDPEYDNNAITQDTGTIGTSGTYADIVAFEADLGNLTGNCWGLVISHINHNTSTRFDYTSNGYSAIVTANKYHYGCPDSGWTVTMAQDIRDFHTGFNSLTIERLVFNKVAGRNWMFVPENTTLGGLMVIRQNIIKNNNLGSYCIISASGNNSTQVYSNKFLNGPVFYYAQATGYNEQIYNNVIYNYTTGYDQFSAPTTDSSIIANNVFWNVTNPLANISSVYGFNNAWDGTGNIGFTVESGTIDQIDETFFIDTTIDSCDGFNITSDSPLYQAGVDARAGSNINPAINDCTWTAGAYDIGAYKGLALTGIDSISPTEGFTLGGDTVCIYAIGTTWDAVQNSGKVLFGDSTPTIISWNADSICVITTSYPNVDTVDVIVIDDTPDTITSANAFIYKKFMTIEVTDTLKTGATFTITIDPDDSVFLYDSVFGALTYSDSFFVTSDTSITVTGACYNSSMTYLLKSSDIDSIYDSVTTADLDWTMPVFRGLRNDTVHFPVTVFSAKQDSCFTRYRNTIGTPVFSAKSFNVGGTTTSVTIDGTNALLSHLGSGVHFLKVWGSATSMSDSIIQVDSITDAEIDATKVFQYRIKD